MVVLRCNDKGKLDVGGALGIGVLSVIQDIGLKEPYIGQTILVSGEIAEDLTYYYATSEQTPSSVALGVLMNKDNTVRQAGGFIIQLMPGASEEIIQTLEARLGELSSVTALLDKGMTPEEILTRILGTMKLDITDKIEVRFYCNCDKTRVEKALISLGRRELQEMIEEGKSIEINCHFCNTNYEFTVEELEKLLLRGSGREAKAQSQKKTPEQTGTLMNKIWFVMFPFLAYIFSRSLGFYVGSFLVANLAGMLPKGVSEKLVIWDEAGEQILGATGNGAAFILAAAYLVAGFVIWRFFCERRDWQRRAGGKAEACPPAVAFCVCLHGAGRAGRCRRHKSFV